jgi:mediator of RNA polymerase II transcription subunit 7
MGIMSINPEQYMDKIQDLRTLFINFHHLLNEYRPHQARESLILMMEEQLRRSKDETEGIERMKAKVEGILEGLGQAKSSCELEDATEQKAVKSNVAEDAIWDELAIQFG